MQARFLQTCEAAGVRGSFLIEIGDTIQKISARALLTDLVVLNAAHPPALGLHGLGSRLRRVIRHSARPILVMSENIFTLERALLAFDGSSKSKEALFLAAYLAEQWHTPLTVVTMLNSDRVKASALDYARAYLELHELQADYLLEKGPISIIQNVIRERDIDFLLMGNYSVSWLEEVTKGSMVNYALREIRCPKLICR